MVNNLGTYCSQIIQPESQGASWEMLTSTSVPWVQAAARMWHCSQMAVSLVAPVVYVADNNKFACS